jgi:hypothetical protein
MSGETENRPSGWTVDTLKELQDERDRHYRELRATDQRAIELVQKYNDSHFLQLNENAKRTIEERSHFVSVEAFEPFREQTNKQLNVKYGEDTGTSQAIAWVIAGSGVLFGLVGIGIAVLK